MHGHMIITAYGGMVVNKSSRENGVQKIRITAEKAIVQGNFNFSKGDPC